ncbi:MAG: ATP-binding protein [Lachnospiraceae bacterium]|nr:ATP-binding protein [Lachnospiraceae bacterium]
MNEKRFEAVSSNFEEAQIFVNELLNTHGCPEDVKLEIDLAIEEIFVNIADYAYTPDTGDVVMKANVSDDGMKLTLIFEDSGTPFDPLKNPDPDITLPASERQIGGLGIFLVKETMDDMFYEYKDGKNQLTLVKAW